MAKEEKETNKKERRKVKLDFLIPIGAVIIALGLQFSGIYDNLNNQIYDLFLHLKPDLEEHESILLLDVDDTAISKVGFWPWSRHIMADGLITMKEFGARAAVFDIEYRDESALGVNSEVLNEEIPETFNQSFGSLQENISQLAAAVEAGQLPADAVPDYLMDLNGFAENLNRELLAEVQEIARDNDAYLGRAAHLFEDAFFTINVIPMLDEDIREESREWAMENLSLKNVTGNIESIEPTVDLVPTIDKVIRPAAGAGFTNIIIDDDGVRRRIYLMRRIGDTVFGQLGFRPLLDWLGNPDITVGSKEYVLKDAELPDGTVKDIVIPRTPGGEFLINWPKKEFRESFNHLSYYYVVLHKRQEDRLVNNLRAMEEAGMLTLYDGDSGLLQAYDYAEALETEILQGGDPARISEYREIREFFFSEVGAYLNGPAKDDFLGQIDSVLRTPGLSEEDIAYYEGLKEDVTTIFAETAELLTLLEETRSILAENLNGAFCFIGWTGTSTTDRGVNPFSKEYDNVGTHASVVNTILQERFLDMTPWWVSALIALVLAAAVFFSVRNLRPGISIVVGICYIIVYFAASIAVFIFLGYFIGMMTALSSLAGTFVGMTVFQFLSTAREKTFIQNAFGRYLSGTVVNELINHPEKLSLGGEKRYMTACFTDIRGFSTISESLDPTELVRLLNMYLTSMSDILLDQQATIDKYEGDAIIAFFGAPIDLPDHAERACRSAVRMKVAEGELNRYVMEQNLSPSELYTRVGINSGDMVVGNMGTSNKMDYTIMGNSVNLAARLEGVNKQYGTWILMSQPTYEAGGNKFVTRMLDRVRVVGIHEPVRLYELVGEPGVVDDRVLQGLEIFHQGLELFEAKQWKEAEETLRKVYNFIPDDGPSKTFINRCIDFEKNPPKQGWDGVFSLTVK